MEEKESTASKGVMECEMQEQAAVFATFKAKLSREQAAFAFYLEKKKEHDAQSLAAATRAREAMHDKITEAVDKHMETHYNFEKFRKIEDGLSFMERATVVPREC